jgi:hypothetical protein
MFSCSNIGQLDYKIVVLCSTRTTGYLDGREIRGRSLNNLLLGLEVSYTYLVDGWQFCISFVQGSDSKKRNNKQMGV